MFSIPDSSLVTWLWVILAMSWATINVFWCIAMLRALEQVVPNAKMKPENVWLSFIPFFGLVWQFMVATAVADSLGEEYKRRSVIAREARPGQNAGLTANILLCCAIIPSFGILIALVGNITRIIHLVKIRNYTKEIKMIADVQAQYPQPAVQYINWEIANDTSVEENLNKNNPNRFMPPATEEEDKERWGKK